KASPFSSKGSESAAPPTLATFGGPNATRKRSSRRCSTTVGGAVVRCPRPTALRLRRSRRRSARGGATPREDSLIEVLRWVGPIERLQKRRARSGATHLRTPKRRVREQVDPLPRRSIDVRRGADPRKSSRF